MEHLAEIIQIRDTVVFVQDDFNEVRQVKPNDIPEIIRIEGQFIDLSKIPSEPCSFGMSGISQA